MKLNKKAIKVTATVATVGILSGSLLLQSNYFKYRSVDVNASTALTKVDYKTEQLLADTINSQISTTNNDNIGKDETVYVNTDASGNVLKITVSDWLKNYDKSGTLKDSSDLTDITNVKGYEEYTQGSDNALTWEANGNDIYYQGTTTKKLPVDVKLTYFLDGNEISPEDLAGKSGKVTIRFDYTNNQKETVNIDGEDISVYVPFTMISGLVLPTDTFTNIQVSNGKVISEGSNAIAVGVALPGLMDNLELESKDSSINIPDYFEVTADVEDFSLNMTMTLCLSDILTDVNLDDVTNLSELEDKLNELSDSSTQLKDGAQTLNEGISTLQNKTSEFTTGISTLSNGLSQAQAGINTLANSTSALNSGAEKLNQSTQTLVNGLSNSNSGIDLLAEGFSGDTGLVNGSAQLSAVASQVDAGIDQLSSGVNDVVSTLTTNIQTLQTGIDQIPEEYRTADNATYQYYKGQIEALQQVLATLSASNLSGNIAALKNGTSALNAGNNNLANGISNAYAGVEQLQSGISQLYQGSTQLQAGTQTLYDSTSKLNDGTQTLNSSATKLASGSSTLLSGSNQLSSGIDQLATGANTLSDGITKFDSEGIQKIVQTYNGDVKDLIKNLKATVEAGHSYHTFTQISDGVEGSVKFIYKTDEIN